MHSDRLKRLQAAMARADLECVAAIAGPNLYYLTGISFHLSERPTVGFFPAHDEPVIVAGNLEELKVKSKAPYPVRGFYYTDGDGPVRAFRQAAEVLKLSQRRLGVEMRRMRDRRRLSEPSGRRGRGPVRGAAHD
jgi:Xaa-Pro dipeptidase